MSTKQCSKCKTVKGTHEFDTRKASKDGLTAQCTMCLRVKAMKVRSNNPEATRSKNLKNRFNMSIDDYNEIFLKQKGRCAICDKAEVMKDIKGNVKWLAVDHNHDTNKIRGLLCNSCNTGIGKLGDSIKVLQSAIKYLKKEGSYGES